MGLSFESLIGVQRDSQRQALVTAEYLSLLVKIANERFDENKKRIARFREALRLAFGSDPKGAGGDGVEEKKKKGDSGEWEDAQARAQRKREEGLARREEVRKRKEEERERKRREAEEAGGGPKEVEGKKEDKDDVEKESSKDGKVDLAEVVLQVPDVL